MGGWWNALLKGQPPTPDVNPSGFRSATLMFAVAGLSRWFSWKQQSKAVSWAVSIRVNDGCPIFLLGQPVQSIIFQAPAHSSASIRQSSCLKTLSRDQKDGLALT